MADEEAAARDGDEDRDGDGDRGGGDAGDDKGGDKGGDSERQDGKGGGADPEEKRKRRPLWPWLLGGAVVLVFVAVVLAIEFIPTSAVWTDDAYVMVHYASVSPRIAGQVVSVAVDDNQTVGASRELVRLDDRDQRADLATAQGTLARDRARLADALADVGRQPSLIRRQDSEVRALAAQIGLAQANQARYRNLAKSGAGSEQSRQGAEATLAQLQAEMDGARASADAARHQLDILHAVGEAAAATIRIDEARVREAELTLSYTRILSPFDATVSERSVQLGDYVTPGMTMMSLVPLDRLYVIANYLETALTHVLPGQHVRIHVDAYDIDLDGVVQGVPPATGAIYSPVPPENATGNFTKIVQRLPVKILVTPGQPLARLLRAGFSVETTIDTHLADVVAMQSREPGRVTSR